MSESLTLRECILRICYMERTLDLLEKQVLELEHYSNQSSILVDTLGSIMEELRKQEH